MISEDLDPNLCMVISGTLIALSAAMVIPLLNDFDPEIEDGRTELIQEDEVSSEIAHNIKALLNESNLDYDQLSVNEDSTTLRIK